MDSCDGLDTNCNGVIPATELDDDGDGTIACADCDDGDTGSTIIADDADCDGIETADDCDDADDTSTAIADDADCDGAETTTDCDDSDPDSYPGAPGLDEDCQPSDSAGPDDTDLIPADSSPGPVSYRGGGGCTGCGGGSSALGLGWLVVLGVVTRRRVR